MKTFDNRNYYEVLVVAPDAEAQTIKQAYREALELYNEDSLATYSLFSDEQRSNILQVIDEAYHTLIDADRRAVYDQMLAEIESPESKVIGAAGSAGLPSSMTEKSPAREDLKERVKDRYKDQAIQLMAKEVIGKDLVSGNDLRRLREALNIELREVFEQTRITVSMLTAIEENQVDALPAEIFLRSFLKAYAEILCIDGQRLTQGYLKHLSYVDPAAPSK